MNRLLTLSCAFLVASLLLAPLPGQGKQQTEERRVIEKSLPASGVSRLRVQVRSGNVRVVSGANADAVQVRAVRVVRARSKNTAKGLADACTVLVKRSGDAVTVDDVAPRDIASPNGDDPQIQLDIEVKLPANRIVELTSDTGNLEVTGATRTTVTRTQTGNVRLMKMSSGSVEVESQTGSLDFAGQVERLQMTTQTGSVRVLAPSRVRESLALQTQTGNVSAEIASIPGRGVTAETQTGSVRVSLPSNARVNAVLSSANGDASSAFALTRARRNPGEGSELMGNINGGGPSVRLRTETGSVELGTR